MQKSATLVLQTGKHSKRNERLRFLTSVASTSTNINLQERETVDYLRSPISFYLCPL